IIRTRFQHLSSIEKHGFLNQHQTMASAGSFVPAWRNFREQKFLNVSPLATANASPSHLFPKYGFLSRTHEECKLLNAFNMTRQYGELLFVLKRDALDRASYTLGDSLVHADSKAHPVVDIPEHDMDMPDTATFYDYYDRM